MSTTPLKIVFHGQNAANFRQGFEALIAPEHQVLDLSDGLDQAGERAHYENADVVIGIKLNADMPQPLKARLFHAPAAGTDAVNTALLPPQCTLANCFGHENAIAEYVIAALLMRHVPLAQADQDLRQQRWTYWAGRPTALRTELGAQTLGLVGFGHIAQTVAQRAKAMGMRVHVANRSPITHPVVDRSWTTGESARLHGLVRCSGGQLAVDRKHARLGGCTSDCGHATRCGTAQCGPWRGDR